MKKIYSIAVVMMLSFLSIVSMKGAPSIRIICDASNNKVEVGESFHITIEATDCAGKIDVNQMPPGVKVVYHTSRQSSATSVAGGKSASTHTTSLIMTCKGETPGKYTFGPVSIDGKKSNTISYQVVAASSGGSKSNSSSQSPANPANINPNSGPQFIGKGNEEIFLKASVNKTTAYEQEAIEYTVKLYTTYDDIKFLGAAAAPKFDGFVIEESNEVSTSFKFEDYNGKSFKTAVIARYIIFPQKSGSLKVLGNTYTVSTDAKQYYHDPYFQTMTVRYPIQLNVTPNDVDINVKALPTPIPSNFIGGVGQFSLKTNIPSKNLASNTPAQIIYTIEGRGNIKYIKLPELSGFFPKSFEIYSPEVNTDVKVGVSNVSGETKFDYSIVPRETGNFKIPQITFSYFNPEKGQYEQLTAQGMDLTVGMGQSSSKSQQTLSFNDELMPIGEPSLNIGKPYVNSWAYWLWYVIPMLIFVVSLSAYRKYMHEHADITGLRSKQANKMALKRLAKAYQCIKNKQDEQFYDEMLAALWGYIGDKLKMPTSELNRSNVSEEFKKHGVKEATFQPIIKLIDECEYSKYTPVARSANMLELYSEAVESLANVEREYAEETRDKTENMDETGDNTESSSTQYINTSGSSTPSTQQDDEIKVSTNKPSDIENDK